MVAIVSGNSLGLNLSSLALTGVGGRFGTAAQGRNHETAYVNVANGNLVLQNLDSTLQGLGGSDVLSLRTYNSQGLTTATGWRWGPYKSVTAAGEFLQRTDSDGSVALYAWDAHRQAYVQTFATGTAVDTLVVNEDGGFTWTDGASGVRETYEAGGAGLIQTAVDTSGHITTFTHDASGLLTDVATASGESAHYDYERGALTGVRTTLADGRTLRQVRYDYDALGRLHHVVVNLDPNATSFSERGAGNYLTTYDYDGDSHRVASVKFGDGTQVSYEYELVDGGYRVATVTDGQGHVTDFSYDTATRTTTVTDPRGVASVYGYDEAGRLTQVREGVTAAGAAGLSQLDYTYNDLGEVTHATDAAGRLLSMHYDAQGNLISRSDGAGNTVTWSYDDQNQVLTETVYLQPAQGDAPASQPLSTRNVYSADHPTQLRFVISAGGQVTEHRYDAAGQRVATLHWSAATFDTRPDASALDLAQVLTEADLQTWVAAQPKENSLRQDFSYDFRGQLKSSTTYSSLDSAGEGLVDAAATTHYIYDPRGALLQTISPDGDRIVHTVYDGLGRVLSTTTRSADGGVSATHVTQYDDASGKVIVTFAGGLISTSAFDAAGRLISVTQSAGSTALGVTRFDYDAAGRLLMTTDPSGARTWALYDEAGRKQADIDATGRLTEYTYDAGGLLVRTTGYATAVDVSLLVNAEGRPAEGAATPVTLQTLRPAATALDVKDWNVYDAAGRLTWQVNALGEVTRSVYDGASRVTATLRYAVAVDTATWGSEPTADLLSVVVTSDQDRTLTRLYNRDGLLMATVDGEGYLVQYGYDAAGQLVQMRAYANRVPGFPAIADRLATAQASHSLSELLPEEDEADRHSVNDYNSRGQLVGQVDAAGYLTETVYDSNGQVARVIRYGQAARRAESPSATVADRRPTSSPQDQVSLSTWDALGRLSTTTNAEGTVTHYRYDDAGRLTHTTVAVNTTQARTLLARYDMQGRLVAELPAVGAALMTGEQTEDEIESIWQQYGLRHTYDAAGRRTSTTDALGHCSVFFYDDAGRLRYGVDAEGSIVETRYDALGRVTHTSQYARALDRDTLAGLRGGLLSATANQAAVAALSAAWTGSTAHSTTTQDYDAASRLVQVRDAEGGTTAFGYDAFGGVSASTRSRGDGRTVTTLHDHDHRGLETHTVADDGGIHAVSEQIYDAFGRVVSAVDANGHTTTTAYDALGRVVTVTNALRSARALSYDAFSRILTDTDARGAITRYAYDAEQRSVTVTQSDGTRVVTVHNRHGQTLHVTDAEGATTTYAYDEDGRLRTTTTPTALTSQTYDRAGRLAHTVDAEGHVVVYSYDAVGRILTRRVDPEGLDLTTRYAYDAKGLQVRVTDPRGVVTHIDHDLAGRVLRRTLDPVTAEHAMGLNLITEFSYDDAGQVLTLTEPGGRLTKYVYDALGRRFQTIIDPQGLALTTTYSHDAAGNMVASESAAARTRYVYDAADQLVVTVDPMGAVTQTLYDANGNVTGTIRYATRIDVAAWEVGSAPPVIPDPAHDQEVRVILDSRNRAVFTLSKTEAGQSYAVVERQFDGNGRVTRQVAYSQAIDAAVPLTLEDIPQWVHPDAATDASQRFVYDAAGNLAWSVDGVGGVVQQVHDANGNLIKQVAYATALREGQPASEVAGSAADRVSLFVYDAAGRLRYSVDAMGGVTQRVWDAAGNVVQSTTFATRLAPPEAQALVPTEADLASQVLVNPADRISRAVYDSANRQIYSIDAAGAVVRNHYDRNGQMMARTAYATAWPVDTLPEQVGEAEVQAFLVQTPELDRTTHSVFDAAGRRVYAIDALGYVTRTVYDGLGHISGTTQYAAALPAVALGMAEAEIEARLNVDPLADRTQTFRYDAAGHLLSATDALGHEERFTYNALGQKLSFTHKNGALWTYEYDAAGRLSAELAPLNSTATPASSGVVRTELAYDALGNLIRRTEAAHTSIARTTTYVYDALGRQVETVFAAVRVYDASADAIYNRSLYVNPNPYWPGNPYGDNDNFQPYSRFGYYHTETSQVLHSRVIYNVFGDAVAGVDVSGYVNAKVYDKRGRVVTDVDALGYVTEYQRNTFGDVTALTRHAQASTPATPAGLWSGSVTASPEDRTIITDYDKRGRAIQTTQPLGWVFDGVGAGYEAAAVSRTDYNAFGDVILTSVRASASDGSEHWADTTHHYDRRGSAVATIDAMGYLTRRRYDAVGNLIATTEHAMAVGSRSDQAYGAAPTSAQDRTTTFTYDLGNRLIAQTRVQVAYHTVASSSSSPTEGIATIGDLTTTYGYDALGHRIRTTDALGGSTYTYYDTLGRIRAVAGPATTSSVDGSPMISLMEFERDALGNVLRQTQYGSGAAWADESGYAAAPGYSWNNRTTDTRYDSLGRAIEVTDANGAVRWMSYDAAGRLAKSWQLVQKGMNFSNGAIYTGYQYDALGRVTGVITPASIAQIREGIIQYLRQEEVGSLKTGMVWNAFGEMVARGTYDLESTPQYQEWFQYDTAGRLWRTNSGDGTVRVTLHDLQGRVTAQLSSAGSRGSPTNLGLDLSTLADAQQADALGANGVRRIDNQLDVLGRVLTETPPERTGGDDAPAYRPVIHRSYDRWGNVLTQSDVRNATWITRLTYNANNQLIEQIQPDDTGAVGADSPVTRMYYDELGRQVAVRDANDHVNGQRWDAAGQLVLELHADGGVIAHRYDVFGQRVQAIDAMGGVTRYAYDAVGRITSAYSLDAPNYGWRNGDVLYNASSYHGSSWTYDEAGRLIRKNGELFYGYDARGNIVATWQITQTSSPPIKAAYDAQGRQIASQDLTVNGSRGGRLSTWTYDTFGLLLSRHDIGGAVYSYTYDAARQLVTQTSTRGQNLTYRYDAAGQVVQITDHALAQHTWYTYDAAGRHVREQTVQGGTTYQNQVLGYDTLGRLNVVLGMDGATLLTTYDKVGNRLHKRTDYNQGQAQQVTDYGTVTTTDAEGHTLTTTAAIGSHMEQRGNSQRQDLWFAYDAMNRQILVDGAANSDPTDAANLTLTQGHLLRYDLNGNRLSDTFMDERIVAVRSQGSAGNPTTRYEARLGPITEWYDYDALNRLTAVSLGAWQETTTSDGVMLAPEQGHDNALVIERRIYDANDNVLRSGMAGALPTDYLIALHLAQNAGRTDLGRAVTTDSFYDTARSGQRLVRQHVVNAAQSVVLPSEDGLPDSGVISVIIGGPDLNTSNSHDIFYDNYDDVGHLRGYRIVQESLSTQYQVVWQALDGYRQASVTATSTNTSSGNITTGTTTHSYDVNSNLVEVNDGGKPANNRQLVNDVGGQVLYKTQQEHTLRQLIASGQVLGRHGVGVDPQQPTTAAGDPNYVAQGDFNTVYQPVDPSHPAATNSWHTVQAGDTLQGIALATYGDAALWYLVADTNGLTGNQDLRAGRVLELPARLGGVTNHAGTYAPDDPGSILGDTTPYLPVPPGRVTDNGCGVFGLLVMVVVAVAVTVATQGAVGPQMVTWLGSGTSAAVAPGAVAGAAGSIASQAVGSALGVVDEFSWKAVTQAALAGGASAAVGGVQVDGRTMGGIPALAGPESAAVVARSMVANALTQGLSVALGLQDRMQWQNIAAAGLGSWAGHQVGDWMSGMRGADIAAASSMTAGLVTAAARGGRWNAIQVAVDIFGNQLGQSLGEAMLPHSSVFGHVIGEQIAGGMSRPGYSDEEMASDFQRENNRFTAAVQASAAEAWRSQGFVPELNYDGSRPVYDFGDPFEVGGGDSNLLAANGSATRLIGARQRTELPRLGELDELAAQRELERVDEMLREARGRGPSRAGLYNDLAETRFRDFDSAGQVRLLTAMNAYTETLHDPDVLAGGPSGLEANRADSAVRISLDWARESGAVPFNSTLPAQQRQNTDSTMAVMGSALARRQMREVSGRYTMGPNDGPQLPTVDVPAGSVGAMRRRDFEPADYHGTVDNAVKSRGPVNGQDALDASVQVKPTSPRRVGIDYDSGEFVVFDRTLNNVYHGHVRAWNDLHPDMQRALQGANMTDKRGRILGGN